MVFFAVSFGKKPERSIDELNYFEMQMDAIREGKRKHPAMITVGERHEETAKVVRKLKWSQGFIDSWGAVSAFKDVRDRPRPQGCAVDFLSVLTLEEREELREIVQEEIKRAAKAMKF